MIKISKKERDELIKLGVVTGENGISRTHSHNISYYLCESKFNLRLLNQIRNKK